MPPTKRKKSTRTWQDIAREAQNHRDQSLSTLLPEALLRLEQLPKNPIGILDKILGDDSITITTLSPEELVRLTSSGNVSVKDIIISFLQRATVAQKITNCITELLPERALSRAESLDQKVQDGIVLGPLHGLPMSVKSHIGIAHKRMPAAYIAGWDNVAHGDALVVKILERAGAVVHARTTEPQSMMHLECSSNLYGETTNPYNTDLSSGGSSGGEGALIALRGSLVGVGSDVGGSIRVPAAACGIYGLKPTGFRVPTTGWSSTPPGADPIPTVIGPMSVSQSGIEMIMRVVLASEPWREEPALIPLPWRNVNIMPSRERPLRLGIMWHDGIVLPHPPITRALREFMDRVHRLPHVEVIELSAYKHDEAWAIVSSLYYTDGGKADLKMIADSGEPCLPLTEWIIKENPAVQNLNRAELEYWLEEREEFRLEYAKEWNKTGHWNDIKGTWGNSMDALICPVGPGVATRPGTAKYWSYTAVWNLLDYPALAFPAVTAERMVDVQQTRTEFMSGLDEDNYKLYDAEVFDQMPVGLQIVGRRFDDEKIVGILKYLQENVSK